MRVQIVTIGLLILISSIFLFTSYLGDYSPQPLVKEFVLTQEYDKAASYLLGDNSLLEERRMRGSEGITLTVVVDFYSEESKEFYEKIRSIYDNEKLYHKYYMSREEYETKSGRYLYAQVAECSKGDIFQVITDLHSASKKDLDRYVENNNLEECVKEDKKALYYDMIESETFKIMAPSLDISIEGQSSSTIIGNKNLDKIQKAITNIKIRIGQ